MKVQYCRVQKMFDKDHKKLILAMEGPPEAASLAVSEAVVQTGAIRKYGRAPPGYMEDELQEWLEVFMKQEEADEDM
jgi:hypothetical protein